MATNQFSSILDTQFYSPISNPELSLIRFLKRAHGPTSQVVSTTVCANASFPLADYLESLGIHPIVLPDETYTTFDFDSDKDAPAVYPRIIAGIISFTYAQTPFRAYLASWSAVCGDFRFYGLVYKSSSDELGQKLASEVYKYTNILKQEIWVFEEGEWTRNKTLYDAIRASNWEDVVLEDESKENLKRDIQTFFESKNVYDSLSMTWKRGILLLGPPGNGKTESIKALVNQLRRDVLYVKSFSTAYGSEYGIRKIFIHARKHAPCILILEDLDSMVTPEIRSYLLNELDGLARNDGLLTIATTNHPERIDDAILNRPSRFDVKYEFGLPTFNLRLRFARQWMEKIQRLGTATVNGDGAFRRYGEGDRIALAVAGRTEGWSFAFLKELFVSYLLRLAHDRSLRQTTAESTDSRPTPEAVLMKQIEQLSLQVMQPKVNASIEIPTTDGTESSQTRRFNVQPQISDLTQNSGLHMSIITMEELLAWSGVHDTRTNRV